MWVLVVAALYAAGALLGPRRRPKIAKATFDPGEIRRSLDHAYQMTHGRLPADVQTKVAEIRTEILELLPHAAEFPPGSPDLYVVRRMATDYLPTTIQAYLALPPAYATGRVVQADKTPLQVLKEQLELLDAKMDEITEAVRRRDSDRLLANGIFLEERFGRPGDGLTLPPRQDAK
ncbi:MAG TPA: hypothetical protein VOB72_07340 [Candidatus Dormibacteraeota bacterium]|nr:hypothetical protein [Candidatus Dormibacteraeota bacterium]